MRSGELWSRAGEALHPGLGTIRGTFSRSTIDLMPPFGGAAGCRTPLWLPWFEGLFSLALFMKEPLVRVHSTKITIHIRHSPEAVPRTSVVGD
jgi:hypothetical protein